MKNREQIIGEALKFNFSWKSTHFRVL